MDIRAILRTLPHRYPFLLVDRILEVEPGQRAVGVKNVTANEPQFTGHWPENPVMPGVLVVEAMAQTAGVAMLTAHQTQGKQAFLGGVDKVRFRRPVVPGDQLIIEAELVRQRGDIGKMHITAKVGDELACSGDFSFVLVDQDQEPDQAPARNRNLTNIHPTATIDSQAELGKNVTVKPYAVIEGGTQIGDDCTIGAYVVIRAGTSLGTGTEVHTGAILGEPPQDIKYEGHESYLKIGCHNHIREFATIHRASSEGQSTRIGDYNLLMAYSHIGHDAVLGNNVIMANNVGISGHCVIEDNVNFGGMVGVHQFVTIGTTAMVGGFSKIVRDVPPYMIVDGNPAQPRGINTRGLQRHDLSSEQIAALKRAYRVLFRSDLNVSDAVSTILEQSDPTPEVRRLTDFMLRIDEGYGGRQLDPH